MSAGIVKNYPAVFHINAVNENPVRFNMTLPFPFVFSMQRVVFMSGEQRNLLYEHAHNFPKLMDVFMAFFHQLAIFIKRTGYLITKHELQSQHFVQVFKRMMPINRYLPPEHGVPFFKGGNSFSVKKLFSGYWVTVRGANRTFATAGKPVIVSDGFGREGKDNRPCWNFAGYVNGQPVAGGYFYGLGNCHKKSIA
jgi:hypothetical protein